MSDETPDMRVFETLVGSWATTATHPMIDGVVRGTATFTWLDGVRFLVQRTTFDHDLVPNAISVIGQPEHGDGLVMEYFDSRGVRRTYRTSFEDGVWRWWRDVDGFDQRFVATVHPDAFEGHGEIARERGRWQDDLSLRYRRVHAAQGLDDDAAGGTA